MSKSTVTRGGTFDASVLRRLGLVGIASFVGMGALLAVLSSCTDGEPRPSGGVDIANNTITLALIEEPPQLDSTRATDTVSGRILGHVVEGLLRYDANNQLAPGMAERWQINENGALFHLRENARWSDGRPVTAHDFVFAWRKVVDPQNASEYAFILEPVKNAAAINRGEMALDALGVEALDDHTLRVELERPIPYFDQHVAFTTYNPVNEAFYESRDGRYAADAENLLYNGPFKITRWVHDTQVRLEKNHDYWDADRIKLDVIDHAYITPDPRTMFNLFKDGDIAFLELVPENINDALRQRWKTEQFNDGGVNYIGFNFREGRLTRNDNLRRALQLVNDPHELVSKIIDMPGNLPGVSFFPVWLKGVQGSFRLEYPVPEHVVDVNLARKHLELALEELGLEKLPPLVLLATDTAKKQSEYYQGLFRRQLGIEVKIDLQTFNQRLDKMDAGEFDMVMAGWKPDYDDPMTFADLFASWNVLNSGRYANQALDDAVNEARSTLDAKVRMDALAKVQRILIEDAVILLNYESGSVYVTDPRIQGLVRKRFGTDPDFTEAWLVPEDEDAASR